MLDIPSAGRLVALFALTALLALACANGDAGITATPEETPPMANPPMGGSIEAGARPGVPLAEILADSVAGATLRDRLDEPERVEAEAVENRHVPGQTDTLRTLVYDGLTLTFYEVTGGGALLQTVEVTGEGYETAEGLGVGSTRGEVEAVYTHSAGAEGSTVHYEHADGSEDPTPTTVEVRYDGDEVEAMTWRFYVD